MTLIADEVTPTGMFLVIAQSGGSYRGRLEYGTDYWLEYRFENRWKRVPRISDDVTFPSDAYELHKDSVARLELDWSMLYGELSSGYYRLVKPIKNFRHEGPDYDESEFYAEFSIKPDHSCSNEYGDLQCGICHQIMPHECLNIDGTSQCKICGKTTDVYRVTGSADWMGLWDPTNELGIMTEMGNGLFRKEFQDVPPGAYELRITKNGKWDDAYGVNGQNDTFVVEREGSVTVDLTLKDGVGTIRVYGTGNGWWEDDDEDQDRTPGTDDLTIGLSVALLLICSGLLALMLPKRNRMM